MHAYCCTLVYTTLYITNNSICTIVNDSTYVYPIAQSNSVKLSKLLSPADSAPGSALAIFSASPPHYAGNPTVCVGVHCHMTGWTHIYTLPHSLTPSPFYSPSLPHSLSSPTPLPLLPHSLTPPPLPLPPIPPTSSRFHQISCSCGFLSDIVRHWTVSSSSDNSWIDTMTPYARL